MKPAVLIIYYFGLVVTSLIEAGSGIQNEAWGEKECARVLIGAKGVRTSTKAPKFSGHWASARCETRSGPEFVLRKYLFRKNKFHAQFYYYADDECTTVSHYISATGTINVKNRPSWRTPGGYEADYFLSKINIIPYTREKAHSFEKLLRRYCPQSKYTTIDAFSKYKVYQFTRFSRNEVEERKYKKDFDCSKLFNFTMNELQLVRLAKYRMNAVFKTGDVTGKPRMDTELLLGDVSTNMKYRRQYRPTHFQEPLKRSKVDILIDSLLTWTAITRGFELHFYIPTAPLTTLLTMDFGMAGMRMRFAFGKMCPTDLCHRTAAGCDVCKAIASSNKLNPPVLTKHRITNVNLHGNWVSERCETRPNGQYLTRHLTFLADGTSWEGVYEFYRDPLCRERHFRLEVKGTYLREGQSKIIPSSVNYIFRTLRLKITPLDFQMTSYLNSYDGNKCGKSRLWKLGQTQDVTGTKGCFTLGISLPNMEFELIKTEYDNRHSYLYVGQRPSDYVTMGIEDNRPTSFQRPLVKCGATNTVVPSYTAAYSASDSAPQILLSTGTKRVCNDIMLVVLSVFVLVNNAMFM